MLSHSHPLDKRTLTATFPFNYELQCRLRSVLVPLYSSSLHLQQTNTIASCGKSHTLLVLWALYKHFVRQFQASDSSVLYMFMCFLEKSLYIYTYTSRYELLAIALSDKAFTSQNFKNFQHYLTYKYTVRVYSVSQVWYDSHQHMLLDTR